MKKRLALTLVLVGCWVAANTQMSEVNDCLRFLPSRMANHIRTVKEYRLPTEAAGARRLVATTRYDRQGYMTYHRHGSEMPDSIECTYDSLNRLVQWKRAECRWDNNSQRMVWSSLFIENLDYTPDGLVSLVQTFTYDRVNAKIDTTVIIYRLIRLECSDRGVTACDYAYYERESSHGMKEEQTDTCLFRREYDTEGHLLHQTYTDKVGSRGLDNYEERYAYDRQGRVLYKISCSYGGCDSLSYRYGAQGNVVEMSGKSWCKALNRMLLFVSVPRVSPWNEQKSATRRRETNLLSAVSPAHGMMPKVALSEKKIQTIQRSTKWSTGKIEDCLIA